MIVFTAKKMLPLSINKLQPRHICRKTDRPQSFSESSPL